MRGGLKRGPNDLFRYDVLRGSVNFGFLPYLWNRYPSRVTIGLIN